MNGELIFAIWYGLPTLATGIFAYVVIKKDIDRTLLRKTSEE